MQLVRNVSNYITRMHYLPSSDDMKMSYTEHDFQVISKIFITTLLYS